ncbi:Creatinase/aminopeptidase [Lentinus tigrinus ALCF2SS1-7]|uniref:Creatinase/aminopeptidase n=1 Tax=Lentinus tigrinus ALCF2SS1-6 TaxID=1328759 RepID=A0A5C2SA89_9APHY|nr:Creatinase/aminopeptidase [Lentinus tigrinus ALCF2SS1-6]RPD72964.1 Creatinase/aminopeptidase [Lentinus tigrinus ALCF2SS1-7]
MATMKSFPAEQHALKTFSKLIELLPAVEENKPQIILLAGETTPYRNDTDREMPFRQESNFYYLSGCKVPGSYLLLTFQNGTSLESKPSSHLFIPKAELADLMWSVPPPSLEEATATHDVTRVDHPAALPEAIHELIKAFPGAIVHTLPASHLFPTIPSQYTGEFLSGNVHLTEDYLLPALHLARLTKDAEEIALIRRANEISSRAHEVVMRVLGQGVRGLVTRGKGAGTERPLLPSEWLIQKEAEAEALFVASCRREGAEHQAYLPIVAASTRASTLHYCCNDREFAWGPVNANDHKNCNDLAHDHERLLNPQVLLIDAGCEWNCYAADITRTMPVGNGGKFTAEARAIYELVLEMQRLSMEALEPGLHWDAIQLICHRTLVRGFQRLGIFKKPDSPNSGSWNAEEAILASGVSSAFFPHGVGHSLGLDVHDVPSASKPVKNETIGGIPLGHESFYAYLRLRLPLEEGMVVTVEPGIYFSPHLLAPVRDSKHIDQEVLKRYESVGGVRIEDVVLITKDGYENLTTVRSDTEWVEKVCSGEI